MKILSSQHSGLGNQLFQYAAALYFSRKYEAHLEVIRPPEDTVLSFGHMRPFMLSKFHISATIRNQTVLDRYLDSKSWHSTLARFLLRAKFYNPQTEWSFDPSITVAKRTKKLLLNGYFQAFQYAQNMEQQLRSELVLRESPSGTNLKILDEIRQCECPVSLHIRRGDYKIDRNGTGILPMTYYRNAIAAIRQIHSKPSFFVFSDDIPYSREALPQLERVVFVDHNTEETAYEDLRLMAACHHHIIANSSFSWWGAWLNPSQSKVVIMPDRWLNFQPPHENLVPPKWKRVPVQDVPDQSAGTGAIQEENLVHKTPIPSKVELLEINSQAFRSRILPHLSGVKRWTVPSRFYSANQAEVAYFLRERGDPRCLSMMTSSILRWPFGDFMRYKVWAHMLLTHLGVLSKSSPAGSSPGSR